MCMRGGVVRKNSTQHRATSPNDRGLTIRATAMGSAAKVPARNATAVIPSVRGTPKSSRGRSPMTVSKRSIEGLLGPQLRPCRANLGLGVCRRLFASRYRGDMTAAGLDLCEGDRADFEMFDDRLVGGREIARRNGVVYRLVCLPCPTAVLLREAMVDAFGVQLQQWG